MSDLFPMSSRGDARKSVTRPVDQTPRRTDGGEDTAVGVRSKTAKILLFEGLVITDQYKYVDADNNLVFTVLRWEDPNCVKPKQFSQSPIDKYKQQNRKDKRPVMHGVPRFVHRLPKVAKTVKTDLPVIVVKGEKDVQSLEALGFVATSGSGGACKWLPEYGESLRDGNIIIIPDNDAAGRKHAEMVARSIAGKAKRIRMLDLPNLPERGDASDWLTAGASQIEGKPMLP